MFIKNQKSKTVPDGEYSNQWVLLHIKGARQAFNINELRKKLYAFVLEAAPAIPINLSSAFLFKSERFLA
jgi:hypothetical protein